MDMFLFFGGVFFIVLGVLSFVNRDIIWNIYSRERRWREREGDRTPEWDARTRKQGVGLLVVGALFIFLSFMAGS